MNKLFKLCLAIVSVSLIGCVQVEPEAPSKQSNLAISSVRDLPVSYPQGSVFSLDPKYVEETSLKAEQTQNIYKQYSDAIIQELEKNGFRYNSTTKAAAFHVGFGIALASDLSDETINEKFGVTPGLPASEGLDKGSFLIYIEDTQMMKKVWRGAVQGFAHKELDASERKTRTEHIVHMVMKQFYATNKNN
ncbi:DUF4136 domain-containing protein [Litorilituus lipolyticus]|uniref:DUF4136 domain-containing protein n=1 Tax=Litorilituus lipolyticus TaxID=2491017 RepID=A0A502KTR2_9GAMM|nr:DUF4136 domain-containing protein [Litorilituus lipolyticus]TPH15090.1 DUF4136 domain-containing protein [Litorilituus lipolyticus]